MKKINLLILVSSIFFAPLTFGENNANNVVGLKPVSSASNTTNSKKVKAKKKAAKQEMKPITYLYADLNRDRRRDPGDPLLVMSAEDYKAFFGYVPMERMLRAQIKNDEYIALNQTDLDRLDKDKNSTVDAKDGVSKIHFARVNSTVIGSFISTTASTVKFGKLRALVLNVRLKGKYLKEKIKGRMTTLNKYQEVDAAQFGNNKSVAIETAKKRTDEDMPSIGL